MQHLENFQKTTKIKPFELQKMSYPEAIARSLVQYAQTDKDFAIRFWQLLAGLNKIKAELINEYEHVDVSIISPDCEYSSWKRAEWLLERIRKYENEETEAALKILSAWAESWSETNEKQVVIGIVGVAIPGITLGLVKRRRPMSVIIRQDIKEKSGIEFAKRLAYITNELVAKASIAGNDNFGLDPDIADWFYHEKDIVLFAAGRNKLDSIPEELASLGIIHSVIEDDRGLALMAVSPAVGPHHYENSWGLAKL